MSAVPADPPDTNPVDAFTVATAVLLLLHAPVPPPITTPFAVKVAVEPIQSGVVPVTDVMVAFGVMVTDCFAVFVPLQPPVMFYIMSAVPADPPVTNPVYAFTVTTAILLLLHAPDPPPSTTPFAV